MGSDIIQEVSGSAIDFFGRNMRRISQQGGYWHLEGAINRVSIESEGTDNRLEALKLFRWKLKGRW